MEFALLMDFDNSSSLVTSEMNFLSLENQTCLMKLLVIENGKPHVINHMLMNMSLDTYFPLDQNCK